MAEVLWELNFFHSVCELSYSGCIVPQLMQKKRLLLLLVVFLVACTTMLFSTTVDVKQYLFNATNVTIKPIIIPLPLVYGKRTNFSKNPDFDSKLAIVEIIDNATKIAEYRSAITSVQCYATLKGHFMYLLYMDDYKEICGHHKDIYYLRHCVTANLMKNSNHDWYVFLDSDMEVINPNRSFSEYMDVRFDVILFDRFWNWEIMAGSFIVKGSQFGYEFVKGFANFEFEHPKIDFHGTDNGAIQAYVAEIVLKNGREKVNDCWEIWKLSKGWYNIFDHEWCIRKYLGAREEFDNVNIFRKGTAWARDGSLTNGKWSPEVDFIFHLRKEKHKRPWNSKGTGYWYDTRVNALNLTKCEHGIDQWQFRPELIQNKTTIVEKLTEKAKGVNNFMLEVYGHVKKRDVIKKDMKERPEVVDHFSKFHLD